MKFTYHSPETLPELLFSLKNLEDYALLAGGTDLLVKMKEKLVAPRNIVDLKKVEDLKGIREKEGYLDIGSLVTHGELEKSSLVRSKALVLAEAALQVGSPQIRNMGTVGGNIGNASPAADTVPALLALDTKVEIRSSEVIEEKDLLEVFQGPGKTCLQKGQLITRLKVPVLKKGEGAAFLKFGKRKALAISVINGAVWLKVEKGGIVNVRLALGSVAPTPIRLFEIEKWLVGQKAEASVFEQAGRMAREMVKPIDDIRSTAAYRRSMADIVVARVLDTALRRVQEV